MRVSFVCGKGEERKVSEASQIVFNLLIGKGVRIRSVLQ